MPMPSPVCETSLKCRAATVVAVRSRSSDRRVATKSERQRFWLEMTSDPSATIGNRRRAAWLLVRSGGALPSELRYLIAGRRPRRASTRRGIVITIVIPVRRPRKPTAVGEVAR